ncbi:MAG: hypothetical protein ACT4P0_08070 [Panacagrimonas sp.]
MVPLQVSAVGADADSGHQRQQVALRVRAPRLQDFGLDRAGESLALVLPELLQGDAATVPDFVRLTVHLVDAGLRGGKAELKGACQKFRV